MTHERIAGIAAALMLVGIVGCVRAGRIERVRTLEKVRARDSVARDLLDSGVVQSPTIKRLVAHLQTTSVIVLVGIVVLPAGDAGRTALIATTGSWRWIRVDLNPQPSIGILLAALGHELQHAVEIADEQSVVDTPTLEGFYQRIGFSSDRREPQPGHRSYETRAAIDTGRHVYLEVCGPTIHSCS